MRLLDRLLNGGIVCSLITVLLTGCGGGKEISGVSDTGGDSLMAPEISFDASSANPDLPSAFPVYGGGESPAVFATGGAQQNNSNLVVIDGYSPNQNPVSADPDAAATFPEFITAYNQLAIKLFNKFSTYEENSSGNADERNVVLSPFTMAQVIGMVSSGAAGKTAEEFQNIYSRDIGVGRLNGWSLMMSQQVANPDPKIFHSRNIVWGHTNYLFLPGYLDNLAGYYQASLSALNFTTLGSDYQAMVDSWINKATNNQIAYIGHDNEPAKTRLIMTGAARLDARWDMPFDPEKTSSGLFQKLDNLQYRVPMLRSQGVYNSYQDDTVTIVELPLAANKYSMVIFMPEGPLRTREFDMWLCNWRFNAEGVGEIVQDESCYRDVFQDQHYFAFKNSFLEKYQQLVDLMTPRSVEVKLPIFSIDSNNYSMVSFLQANGVYLALDKKQANFSGINSLGYTYLKDFRQSAVIRFNAQGLNGASAAVAANEATPDEPPWVWKIGVGGGWGLFASNDIIFGTYPPLPDVVPDARPFLFVVRDTQTKAILYIGSMVDPGGILVN
ncbi:MAG: hypothetical protein A2511_17340 [Deltaproteobacteria bacterium RIFOXYD12_FULL_50_9]|nr:MAG: hypothetical protein A2511_17340 [Deltaproteobacteria bacterium RIFOXYD12_FULL_50_9]